MEIYIVLRNNENYKIFRSLEEAKQFVIDSIRNLYADNYFELKEEECTDEMLLKTMTEWGFNIECWEVEE